MSDRKSYVTQIYSDGVALIITPKEGWGYYLPTNPPAFRLAVGSENAPEFLGEDKIEEPSFFQMFSSLLSPKERGDDFTADDRKSIGGIMCMTPGYPKRIKTKSASQPQLETKVLERRKISDYFVVGWKRSRDEEFAKINALIGDRNITNEIDKPHRTYGVYPNDIPGGVVNYSDQRIFFDGPPVKYTTVQSWRKYIIDGNEISYKH